METRSLPPPYVTSRHTPTQAVPVPSAIVSKISCLCLQNASHQSGCTLSSPKQWRAPPPQQRGPLLGCPPALSPSANLKSCTVGRSRSKRSILAPSQLGWGCEGPEHRSLPRKSHILKFLLLKYGRRSQAGGGLGSAGHLTKCLESGFL